jgi:hypothetical protein
LSERRAGGVSSTATAAAPHTVSRRRTDTGRGCCSRSRTRVPLLTAWDIGSAQALPPRACPCGGCECGYVCMEGAIITATSGLIIALRVRLW